MRSLVAGELDTLRVAVGSKAYMTVEVTNFGGDWVSLVSLPYGSRNLDFFNSGSLRDDIDSNTWTFSGQFAREIGTASLSPFRSDSAVNDTDPALDLHRRWRVWVAAPNTLNGFRELARGWLDRIDIPGDSPIITVQGRGEEADLIDRRIMFVDATADPLVPITSTTTKPFNGGAGGAPAPVGDVIQEILDDQLGPGVITLTVDASVPGTAAVNGWDQADEIGLFDLISNVAATRGLVVRYRYDASDNLTLTLFKPRRNATPADVDWTTNARAYERLNASIDIQNVRNFVVVKYQDTTFGVQAVTSPVIPPFPPVSASVLRYGLRPMSIDLSAETQVTDQEGAGDLADAVVSDTEFPAIQQELTEVNAWFGELWDYVRTDANGVHYNEDQYGGVTSVEHSFANGMLRSSFGLRGKPAGRYLTWLNFGSGPPRVPFTPTVTANSATWKEFLVSSSYVPGVNAVATVNELAQSVQFELSETLDFAVIISTNSADVVDGTAEYGWVGSGFVTPGKIYYVRATAFSGPLSGGTPTGVQGTFIVANTSNLVQPEDTATVEWDLDEQGKWKASVVSVPIEALPDEVTSAAGAIYRVPVFDNASGIEEIWNTIGGALFEPSTKLRRRADLTGASGARLVATITETDAPPGCEARVAYGAPGGGALSDLATGLPLDVAGEVASEWFPVGPGMATDIVFAVKTVGGDDAGGCALASLALEVSATGYGGADLGGFSDPFDTPGPLSSPWIPFSGPGSEARDGNWVTDGEAAGGTVELSMTNNGVTTARGYYRADVPPDSVWTIEMPTDADVTPDNNAGSGFVLYEAASGNFLLFGVFFGFGTYALQVRNQAGALVGSSVVVGDWGATTLRMRRNGGNLEFSYDRGSGWSAHDTVAIASHFSTMFDHYGFFNQTWTGDLTSRYEIWNRIE